MTNIIVFSGTDGSGKSTQIKLLIDEFFKKGLKTKYIWARGGYTPLFIILKKALRLVSFKFFLNDNTNREKLLKNKSVSNVWLSIAIIDLLILYGVYARALSLFGIIVICDRYIEDTLIDFKRNFPENFNERSFLWRLLVLFSPRPNKSFVLFVPIAVSIERSKKKSEPFPDTIDTLAFRLKIYLDETVFPSDKYYKIDCTHSIESIKSEIKNKFEELS